MTAVEKNRTKTTTSRHRPRRERAPTYYRAHVTIARAKAKQLVLTRSFAQDHDRRPGRATKALWERRVFSCLSFYSTSEGVAGKPWDERSEQALSVDRLYSWVRSSWVLRGGEGGGVL